MFGWERVRIRARRRSQVAKAHANELTTELERARAAVKDLERHLQAETVSLMFLSHVAAFVHARDVGTCERACCQNDAICGERKRADGGNAGAHNTSARLTSTKRAACHSQTKLDALRKRVADAETAEAAATLRASELERSVGTCDFEYFFFVVVTDAVRCSV